MSTAPVLSDLLDRYGLGRDDVAELDTELSQRIADEVGEIAARQADGDGVIPVVTHDELASLDADRLDTIRSRACVVVRGTFEREQAVVWNDELSAYLDANRFHDELAEHEPERAASGSGISPIFWSKPQIAARQHDRMVEVRRFLNGLWHAGDPSAFDPDHDIGYADRIRWRPPGATARGLHLHCDSPATSGWHDPENHRVFAAVLGGRPELHDPWDATNRVAPSESEHQPAAVFRTFQGWTALTEVEPTDGVLQIVPIPLAVAHLMVRGIAAELGLHGDPEPAPARVRGAPAFEPAAVRIPAVEPGDTVWWHGDLLHAVEPAANTARWSNVMYIGASPRCPRNEAYRARMRSWFESGESPPDFGERHYEPGFVGRAAYDDLNPVGRQQLGYDPVPNG